MRVEETPHYGRCQACERPKGGLNIVTFENKGVIKTLCDACVEWTKKLLYIVDVKESEA